MQITHEWAVCTERITWRKCNAPYHQNHLCPEARPASNRSTSIDVIFGALDTCFQWYSHLGCDDGGDTQTYYRGEERLHSRPTIACHVKFYVMRVKTTTTSPRHGNHTKSRGMTSCVCWQQKNSNETLDNIRVNAYAVVARLAASHNYENSG